MSEQDREKLGGGGGEFARGDDDDVEAHSRRRPQAEALPQEAPAEGETEGGDVEAHVFKSERPVAE